MKDINESKNALLEAMKCAFKQFEEDMKPAEPEFKVGQWVITPAGILRRIKEFADNDEHGVQRAFDDFGEIIQLTSFYRPATPAEIEAHLKKICDEKGLMQPGQRYKSATSKQEFTFNKYGHTEYSEKYDSLYNNGMDIYSKGKFAEVIPDKKKLPKTREEYSEFLINYVLCSSGAFDFLNEYDFES